MKQVLDPILAGLTVIGAAYPQSEVARFSGSIVAGFTTPLYGTGHRFDNGWNAGAGVGFSLSRHLGVEGQFQFNNLDVNSATLNGLGSPDEARRRRLRRRPQRTSWVLIRSSASIRRLLWPIRF